MLVNTGAALGKVAGLPDIEAEHAFSVILIPLAKPLFLKNFFPQFYRVDMGLATGLANLAL